jgi:tRNA nucleotidyltransferase (CCA-adding enzyme)
VGEIVELSGGARAVVESLARAGFRPFVVGGAVRDALLGSTGSSKDVDIEVHGADDEQAVGAALEGLGRVAHQGKSFGVISAQIEGESIDVALPRGGAPIEQALARRDFTINAIAWDPISGDLIDPFGGINDLRNRTLEVVSESFADDPLRVLRGVQFIARFGLTPSTEYLDQSRQLVGAYSTLPRERIWNEWRKLARLGRHIEAAARVLILTTWDRYTPLLAELAATPQDPEWHPEGDALRHSLLAAEAAADAADRDGLAPAERELVVFAALLHDAGKPATTRTEDGRIISRGHETAGVDPARRFLLDIGAPQTLADKVGVLTREHMAHLSQGDDPSASAVRRLVRRLGEGNLSIVEWAHVVDADRAGRGAGSLPGRGARWVALAREMPASRAALLRGEDLIERGWTPGPGIGEVIRASLQAQDDGEFVDHPGALHWLEDSGAQP